MYVIKRNGQRENVSFDKILYRIQTLCDDLIPGVDPVNVCQRVIQYLHAGIKTTELDELAAETAASLITVHPHYNVLAARIAISNHQKQTSENFKDVCQKLFEDGFLRSEFYERIKTHADKLQQALVFERDYYFKYFGFKTLQKQGYLLKIGDQVVERPQHMWMRVALELHGDNIDEAIKVYHQMSRGLYTHATPTLFNSGSKTPQMSSCFLLSMIDDSVEGIYDTLGRCARIIKSAGGIGFSVHNIRCFGSEIKSTGGQAGGIVPAIRVFDKTSEHVKQGNKRSGAMAVYLEPWHADIEAFLDLKKNHGKEELRARTLFYALWIPDLFMKRVEANQKWTLFCPNVARGLCDVHGDEFEALYEKYEREGLGKKTIKAQDLWFQIVTAQIETGNPYMMYKDSCNRKSNQQNLGTIRSSNLCCEIVEYTAPDEVAVCNLASIALPKFVTTDNQFDHNLLREIAYQITVNLNNVIDTNYYPIPESKKSNFRHRPIGIGVQGLADLFIKLRLPFTSDKAKILNREIFETIYFGALDASADLAAKNGYYETYPGCPASKGILQYDMWGVSPSSRWNWTALKAKIAQHGLRNSLLVSPMPTATTSQILGNNECFEPYTSNIYTRQVLSGTFQIVNEPLIEDLTKINLWNDDIKNQIIKGRGSVQNIEGIPVELKEIYKTVWELSMKDLMDMAADRGAFIDQSQSLNCFMAEPTVPKLTSMHFYGWKKGLKTGMYYLRTKPVANAKQFTVTQEEQAPTQVEPEPEPEFDGEVCTMKDGCLVCGS